MAKKRTWREKLNADNGLPHVGPSDHKSPRWNGIMVIPAPREVDAIMRQVPKGKLITISEIRESLAKKHNADFACPMTTGIFAWIAAHAAEEARESGEDGFTPYWRTLKTGGELNPKYPGGLESLRAKLESEGHTVTQKGKRAFVSNYQSALSDST